MRITRAMQMLGYVLFAIAGLGLLMDPGVHVGPRLACWLVAYAVFGAAFHLGASAPDDAPRRRLAALGLLTPAMIAMAALFPSDFAELLLVVVASQAAFALSPRATAAWIVAQTALVGWFVARVCMVRGVADVTALLGFQGFAAVAVFSARREAHVRAEASRANERARLARELHDVLGHDLTALGLQLEIATHAGDDVARQQVGKARDLTARLLRDVRQVVGAMKGLPATELVMALRTLADVPRLRVHLDVPDDLAIEDDERAECVLRCVQEIITNTLRHARAANVWIRVRQDGAQFALDAHDDGCGAETMGEGNGLSGMRDRLAQLGGHLEIVRAPGFALAARLPACGRAA